MTELLSLPNCFGNPFAVIDVETTGGISSFHEIIQIGIIPLTLDLEIADITPFYYNIKPNFPERADPNAMNTNGLNLDHLLIHAPTQDRVLDYLLEWMDGLPLGQGKRLTPVAHNWAFERGFMSEWLGLDLMNSLFAHQPRDTMILASMINDRASMMGNEAPFKSVSLGALCRQFGIELDNAHDALADCAATAKLLSALMRAIL